MKLSKLINKINEATKMRSQEGEEEIRFRSTVNAFHRNPPFIFMRF